MPLDCKRNLVKVQVSNDQYNVLHKPNSLSIFLFVTGGKVAAGILIPLFLVFGVIGAFFGYRKYQQSQRGDDNIALSMRGIQEDTDD